VCIYNQHHPPVIDAFKHVFAIYTVVDNQQLVAVADCSNTYKVNVNINGCKCHIYGFFSDAKRGYDTGRKPHMTRVIHEISFNISLRYSYLHLGVCVYSVI